MFDAAKRLQFERAAILRDKIQELEEEVQWETAFILKVLKNIT
jgi:protein-arginine kinase activator protein McsA